MRSGSRQLGSAPADEQETSKLPDRISALSVIRERLGRRVAIKEPGTETEPFLEAPPAPLWPPRTH